MKKILIALVLGTLAYAGCKKKESVVSTLVTVSYPVVTITGQQYFSLHVGDPLPTITAVAFDTFYRDSLPVVIDFKGFDNTAPGLYVVKATAKNRYGHMGVAQVFVAVTEVSDAMDITGWYRRLGVPGRSAYINKVGRGLYTTSNVGGVDTSDASTGPVVSAVFAVLNDSTIDLGAQSVNVDGSWTDMGQATSQSLSLSPSDTVVSYALELRAYFGTQVRSFIKQ